MSWRDSLAAKEEASKNIIAFISILVGGFAGRVTAGAPLEIMLWILAFLLFGLFFWTLTYLFGPVKKDK